jgi:hypothetical protein
MAHKRSTFEYDTIPFRDFPLQGEPVAHVVEMNDSYGFLLSGPELDKLYESDSQDERGGIQCNRFDTLGDWLVEEYGCEKDEAGNIFGGLYEDGDKVPLEEILEALTNGAAESGGSMLVAGVMRITKITGSYRDPEKLFEEFFGGGDDDEEEE